VNADERAKLIQRYRDGHRVVKEALDGITDAELDRSASGEWTPRQIAHHLADSEMMSAIRIRRRLSEHEPVIRGYDGASFDGRFVYFAPLNSGIAIRYDTQGTLDDSRRWQRFDMTRLGAGSVVGTVFDGRYLYY